ncbi:hypothetical protein F2P79_014389 [Pimephales promelas]|nr:hypothetical protein F2P79_014389 [Pimephales promelas]
MDTDTTRETVAVTGFAPFRQYVVNPSWEAAKVVIHLGIAPGSKGITLEQTGKNYCYKDRDVSGLYPVHHCCIEGGPERLDYHRHEISQYLCDFVYYYSLYHGQGKAVLIHVPASGSLASPERLVPQLQTIIHALLRQLDSSADTTSESVDSTQSCSRSLCVMTTRNLLDIAVLSVYAFL